MKTIDFAVIGLTYGHINAMCDGLIGAGANLRYVYDKDEKLVAEFLKRYPTACAVSNEEEILNDKTIPLIASAELPEKRCELGVRVLESGKDFFVDKAPFINMQQLCMAREAVKRTGKKYIAFFGERMACESAVYAKELIQKGEIGRVLNVILLAPHRLYYPTPRPDWFFDNEKAGGILVDIGSHSFEQFLYFTDNIKAEVVSSTLGNYTHKEYPKFEDFGDCTLVGANGATGYIRVDWFTPNAVKPFGDGRVVILGTDGYIEIRKHLDVGVGDDVDNVIVATNHEIRKSSVYGKVGYPFFEQFIQDCIDRTENAVTQEHVFTTMELALQAQHNARKVN